MAFVLHHFLLVQSEVTCAPPTIDNAVLTFSPLTPPHHYLDTMMVVCAPGHYLPSDGLTSYSVQCGLDGDWPRTESCLRKLSYTTSYELTKAHI